MAAKRVTLTLSTVWTTLFEDWFVAVHIFAPRDVKIAPTRIPLVTLTQQVFAILSAWLNTTLLFCVAICAHSALVACVLHSKMTTCACMCHTVWWLNHFPRTFDVFCAAVNALLGNARPRPNPFTTVIMAVVRWFWTGMVAFLNLAFTTKAYYHSRYRHSLTIIFRTIGFAYHLTADSYCIICWDFGCSGHDFAVDRRLRRKHLLMRLINGRESHILHFSFFLVNTYVIV